MIALPSGVFSSEGRLFLNARPSESDVEPDPGTRIRGVSLSASAVKASISPILLLVRLLAMESRPTAFAYCARLRRASASLPVLICWRSAPSCRCRPQRHRIVGRLDHVAVALGLDLVRLLRELARALRVDVDLGLRAAAAEGEGLAVRVHARADAGRDLIGAALCVRQRARLLARDDDPGLVRIGRVQRHHADAGRVW